MDLDKKVKRQINLYCICKQQKSRVQSSKTILKISIFVNFDKPDIKSFNLEDNEWFDSIFSCYFAEGKYVCDFISTKRYVGRITLRIVQEGPAPDNFVYFGRRFDSLTCIKAIGSVWKRLKELELVQNSMTFSY